MLLSQEVLRGIF